MNKHSKGIKKDRALTKEKIEELAQLAYITYATISLKIGGHANNKMPVWEDLFDNQREAWIQVIIKLNDEL